MEVCERSSCVHGYHIYEDIWDAVIDEELQCEREPDIHRSNQYAVTIKRWDNHWSSLAQCSTKLARLYGFTHINNINIVI